MSYIEREKARELIKNFGKGAIEDGMKTLDPVYDIILLSRGVDLIPAADVVEVVRCKDCKHSREMTSGDYSCVVDHRLAHNETDFCSCGERKDGADND